MEVIVTGASKGIGKSIAEIFAANGHNLYICSKNEVNLYKTTEEITTKYPGITIKAKPFDLADKKKAVEFAEWCLSYATPDVLVNNAGFFEPGNTYDEPDGTLESQVAVNLYSAYHVTRGIVPAMMKRRAGHIYNVCSIASIGAYPNGGAYSISKFALYGFTRNLREEMKSHGIKVTALLPGAVMTDSWGSFDNSQKRIMEAGDIAKLVYHTTFLSPQACVEDIIVRPLLGDL
jgi:short-subunit dehydrogenase